MRSNAHRGIAQDTRENDQKAVKPFLLITGMHRSGTSWLARALNLQGVYLGDLEQLTSNEWHPLPDNLRGHWEHKKILELMEKTLSYNKGSWDNPPENIIIEKDLGHEIAECIQELIMHPSLATGFKDPRIILCLDAWLEYLPDDVVIVGIFRHPLKVAESLRKRNQFSYDKSLRLWKTYNNKLLAHIRKHGGYLLNFDLPKQELLSQMARIASKIGLIQDIDLHEWYAEELLHSDTTYDRSFVLPDDILSTYEQLDKTSTQNAESALEPVGHIPQESMSIIRNLIVEIQRQGNYFKTIKENDRNVITDLRQRLENQNLQIKRLQNEILEKVASESVQIKRLQSAILERDARESAQIKLLQNAILEKNAKIAQIEKDMSEEMKYLQRELYARNAEVDAIKRSAIFNVFRRLTASIDRWAPPNTRRANIVRLARSAMIITFNQGWKHLLRNICYKMKLSFVGTNYLLRKGIQTNISVNTQPISADHIDVNRTYSTEEDCKLREFMRLGSANIFKLPRSPLVSIVIPTYYNVHYLKKCLQSIEEKTAYKNYEIIIVTNNKDENSDMRQYLFSLQHRVLLYPHEFSFGTINNYAAKIASGEFLLFLNDDTEIIDPYWLHALLKLGLDENTGAVGAKLIYPDGHLQEAGCIVWKDGNAWNFGRNQDAEDPIFNYVREVDYCSGSCLLVKRSVWDKIGGFDDMYKPSYGEDADLCFRIKELGFKVLYQPLAPIIHAEGRTMGTDINNGYKAFQALNQKKFREKWKHVLSSRLPDSEESAFLERNRKRGLNILFVDHYVPTPDQDSGSLRMYSIISILSYLGHKITFWPDNLDRMQPYTTELQQKGVEVVYGPHDFKTFIRKYGRLFHIALLSRPDVSVKYIDLIRMYASQCKIIYDTVDLHFVRLFGQAHVEGKRELRNLAKKMHDMEMSLSRRSDLTLVCTTKEANILLGQDKSLKLEVLPNIHPDQKEVPSFEGRKDIIFVGGFKHQPNVDAVLYFTKEIFPSIKKQLEEVKLYVVGSNPPIEITSLNSNDIIVTGYVHDLTDYLNRCRVMVAPLRYGSGIKGKITQSLSQGLPLVTTETGAEGIEIADGENGIIADDAKDFADKTVALYRDSELWKKVSRNAVKLAREKCSPEVIRNTLVNILNKAIVSEMSVKSSIEVIQSGISGTSTQLNIEKTMELDWDMRAKTNAKYFIKSDIPNQSDEEFFESGRQSVNETIVPCLNNICKDKNPAQMRMLEIGCGIGRMTMHIAKIFGEVHAIDVSGEMIKTAKEKLKHLPNVRLYKNNGKDLSMFVDNYFDFCFSYIVFQHIPHKSIVQNYVKEVSRVLRPGGIFLFQVHGSQDPNYLKTQQNTWLGVSFSPEEMRTIAEENNFWVLQESGLGVQYYWLTLVRK